MKKYALIIDEETKACQVGLGDNVEFYQSLGFEEMEVEQAYDGGWYVLGYAPQKPLEAYKQEKLNALRTLKDEKLSEFSYNGNTFQINGDSKANIAGKVSAILLAKDTQEPIKSVSWIAKDNTIIQFTSEEFLQFSKAVANHIEKILFENDALRNAINNAESLEALNAVEINLGISLSALGG